MQPDIVTNWSRTQPGFPWMTLLLMVLCVAMKLLHEFLSPLAQTALFEVAGMRPVLIAELWAAPVGEWLDGGILTLVTALFVHASWLHLAGNMAYLWVFGMPVERGIGPLGLLLVFLLGGALGNLVVALMLESFSAPVIGASGAVSAVVGAYLALFPSRRMGLFLPLGLYLQFAQVPALLVIGSWFTLQLVYTVFDPMSSTVAWWTHLAGFTLGIMIALLARAIAQIRLP